MINYEPNSNLNCIVLKIVQHCNLNCSYCYVYNRGDDSWSRRPKIITEVVITQLASQISNHCLKHNVSNFTIEFHGGEPLLYGKRQLRSLIEYFKKNISNISLRFVLQTNGLLLDEDWCNLFFEKKVKIGISIDGPPEYADRYRQFKNGEGTTQKLLNNLHSLKNSEAFKWLDPGFLCVINPNIRASHLINWFISNEINSFDLLLPTANYTNPPQHGFKPIDYLNFLIEAFDDCIKLGERAPQVRLFDLIIKGLLGKEIALDALGGDLNSICVIETNGSIGIVDVGRFCGGDLSEDTIDIFNQSLDYHSVAYNINELQKPSEKCVRCKYFNSCGGGYLPHRFDGFTFNNPSYYCETLFGLTEHIHSYLQNVTPIHWWTKSKYIEATP